MTHSDAPADATEHEMAALIRDFDWSATPLGPRDRWPVSLRVLTDMLLSHPFAMTLLWGTDFIQLYNDPCRVIMGDQHPSGLGQPNRVSWPKDWSVTAPIYERVMQRGETASLHGQPLTLRRHGQDERVFLNLTYSPVHDDHGAVGGVLVTVIETTGQVQAERAAEVHRSEIEQRNATLESFAVLTRDLALDTDPLMLIGHVQKAVLPLLDAGFSQYYELDAGRWHVRSQVGQVRTPAIQAALNAGIPFEKAPTLLNVWRSGEVEYQTVYAPPTDSLADSEVDPFATVALPVQMRGQMQGVLVFALPSTRTWTPADRAVLATVERSLSLALERAAQIQQVEQQRTALQEANEELEAFTYSVSHDLRTPVRHIKGFSDLLRRGAGPQLDLKATHYLTVIDEAAGRMNVLIDAMLDLSRTARLPLRVGPVDLETLVSHLQQELEVDAQGRNVHWEVSPLPLVMADHDTLRQVLSNLLDNALKYTQPRELAVIEVWAEERAAEWAVFVRDNGVGFNPRYQDKLFGVFQRLHLEREFEGTGVGLANVRRIITRHGGTVSGQGVEGEGATFSFTLPR